MKAWILIGFYLLKDIWSRWFETPGGVLARLLVAFILALLLLIIDAAFTLSAESIRGKISQMGVRTIVLSRSVPAANVGSATGELSGLLRPLGKHGTILRLMQTGLQGRDELGQRRMVYVYDREMLAPLATVLPARREAGTFVISEELPPGMGSRVLVDDSLEMDACVIRPPSWLTAFGLNPMSILVPQDSHEDLLDRGYFEMVVFMGNEDADLATIESNVRTLLAMDGMGNVQVNSPAELLDQLDQLQTSQRNWRGGFGLFGGLAVALVFGSISILEYRQNRFIIALLRSFGVPFLLLGTRYLLESLCLVALAALAARAMAIHLHPIIFSMIGIDPGLLDLSVMDPYAWPVVWAQFRGLGLGAFLSVLPVVYSMRTPVGKILA